MRKGKRLRDVRRHPSTYMTRHAAELARARAQFLNMELSMVLEDIIKLSVLQGANEK